MLKAQVFEYIQKIAHYGANTNEIVSTFSHSHSRKEIEGAIDELFEENLLKPHNCMEDTEDNRFFEAVYLAVSGWVSN